MKFQKVVKIISADINTDIKQEKNWQLYLVTFHRSTFSKLVVGIPCSLILSIMNRRDRWGEWGGVKGFLLKDQNLLSMMEVICRGSLSGWLLSQSLSRKVHSLSGDVEISCNTRLCVKKMKKNYMKKNCSFNRVGLCTKYTDQPG